MIPHIESGIPGFDEFSKPNTGNGGIPENTVTMVYGPPKTGKSIFCNQFIYQGLLKEEPGLYITTDQGINQLEHVMKEFKWFIDLFLEKRFLYVIDAISDMYTDEMEQNNTVVTSYVNNPTDLMVKVVSGIKFVYQKNPRFRSVLDSITTLLTFNDHLLVMRVLKAYIMRIKEAGGSAFITYTEGAADNKTETMIKSMVDNIIRLDSETIYVEAMKGVEKREAHYKITEKGLIIE
jgi:KaiC/GvpD/RAD55 family RecA-like ATPase